MKDSISNVKAVPAIVPAVKTAAGDGSTVDVQGFGSLLFVINTGAIAVDGDFGVKVQDSANGSDWADAAAVDVQGTIPDTLAADSAYRLTSLPTSMLSQIEGNFSEMKRLMSEAEKLAYSVQNIEQQFSSTFKDFAADKTGQQIVEGARQRWQQSLSAYEHSLKAGATAVTNIDGTRSQTSSLVGASQSAVGILQATQAGNQLLAVQAGQMADLTAMLAAQGRAEALEKSRAAAAQEQAREQFKRFMTGSSYSGSTVRMFHD